MAKFGAAMSSDATGGGGDKNLMENPEFMKGMMQMMSMMGDKGGKGKGKGKDMGMDMMGGKGGKGKGNDMMMPFGKGDMKGGKFGKGGKGDMKGDMMQAMAMGMGPMVPMVDWTKEKWKTQGWCDWGYDEKDIDARRSKKMESWARVSASIGQALMPVGHLETEWSAPQWQKKINDHIDKAMKKFEGDPRLETFGSGGAMVTEFVNQAMASIQNSCYDRPWWGQVDFTGPLYAAVIIVFKNTKLFHRTTGARFQIWIVDAFNRWCEDQRVEKTLWETVQALGMSKKHEKEIANCLGEAYDEAHAETTFIVPESAHPDMVMLQDFIQYWFKDFVFRAWEVLNRAKTWEREQVKAVTGALFQSLCNPEVKCLPHDLVANMDAHKLMACWAATADKLDILFQQAEAAAKMKEYQPKPNKKQKTEDPMAAAQAAASSIAANLSVRL